jgi:uncharacterized protein
VTLYLDSSAFLKRYVDEPGSDRFVELIASDTSWLTCSLTWVEVWRNLRRRLPPDASLAARRAFTEDWDHLAVVEVDAHLARDAGALADVTGARSLAALHLAALRRAGQHGISLVTADLRQAQAARSLGMVVLGA